MNELGDVTVREPEVATSPAFDFINDIDVNLTPAGYLIASHSNGDPATSATDPNKIMNWVYPEFRPRKASHVNPGYRGRS
jgi:hypothetical protein